MLVALDPSHHNGNGHVPPHEPEGERHRVYLLRRKSAGCDEDHVRHAVGVLFGKERGNTPAHRITADGEPLQAEGASHLFHELHHAFLRIVTVGHGSGQPVCRQVYSDDAERITEPPRPRLPGKERGIGTVNEDETARVARAPIPDVRTRAIRQRHELRRHAGVLRLQSSARDVGLADVQKGARKQKKEDSSVH